MRLAANIPLYAQSAGLSNVMPWAAWYDIEDL